MGGRLFVVPIDPMQDAETWLSEEYACVQELPQWAVEPIMLGRLTQILSGASSVLAFGGAGLLSHMAQTSIIHGGARWTVIALSRGQKEQHPSLMDYAFDAQDEH